MQKVTCTVKLGLIEVQTPAKPMLIKRYVYNVFPSRTLLGTVPCLSDMLYRRSTLLNAHKMSTQALVTRWRDKNSLVLEDVKLPALAPSQLLIKVVARSTQVSVM
jgi:hypothetical protein